MTSNENFPSFKSNDEHPKTYSSQAKFQPAIRYRAIKNTNSLNLHRCKTNTWNIWKKLTLFDKKEQKIERNELSWSKVIA